MTHFLLHGVSSAVDPALLFQVRIDLRDIRSGCSGSEEVYFRAQWNPETAVLDPDLTWTPDMVTRIPRDRLQKIDPPRVLLIPHAVDDLMHRFLERYYRLRIWHNRELDAFSNHKETLDEFVQRCRDLLQPQRSEQMRKLSEVMYHRFLELYQRAMGAAQDEDVSGQLAMRIKSDLDEVLSGGKADLSRLFLRDDTCCEGGLGRDWRVEALPQIQERLDDFRSRLLNRYNGVVSEFEERASSVDPLHLTVTRHSIDILSRNVIWE